VGVSPTHPGDREGHDFSRATKAAMTNAASATEGGHDMCLAVPGRIVEIMDDGDIAFRRGRVDFGGIRKEINLAYTPEAEIGKYVLVHVGFAISVIDEDEAQRVFQYLREMGGLKEELGEIPQ